MAGNRTALGRAGRRASGAALAAAVAVAAVVLLPALWGWQRYAIVSGSMTGTYDRGSLVLDEVVPVADLRVGDVITYLPPPGSGHGHLITHRIVAITRGRDDRPVFRTRGDANPVADPWTFELHQPTQARVRLGIPYAGRVLTALADRRIRLVVIALPALLIAAASLARLWRALGVEARRRSLGAGA